MSKLNCTHPIVTREFVTEDDTQMLVDRCDKCGEDMATNPFNNLEPAEPTNNQ